MKFISSAGDYNVEQPGRLLMRAARIAPDLKWQMLGTIVVTFLATIVRLLGPLVVKGGIDNGIALGDKSAILTSAAVFMALLVVQYGAGAISQWSVALVGERYLVRLRSAVFAQMLKLDMGFFSRSKSGVLVSRMTSDVESLQEFASDGAVMALTNLLSVVGVAFALALVDWQMASAVFAVVAVLVAVSVVFQRQARRAYDQVRERIGRVLASLQEGITGVRVVQAFTQESAQASTFGRVNEKYFDANMAAARAISWYFPVVAFLRTVALVAALAIGARRVLDGTMTLGTLVAFLLYLDWFFQPIINLSNVYNLLQSALAALSKLFQLMDEPVVIADRPGAFDIPENAAGVVELVDVSFSYVPDVSVLTDISLKVDAGERVAIVGETGSGKSTIAKLIMRFYDPDSGLVLLDDVDLVNVTARSRADMLALVPQDGFLFAGTLRSNLRYADPTATDEAIWNVLRAMGIDDWVRSLPDGFETEVRERGGRFSAGERQLVALARAFLADPTVIVLDEATSNLDPETEIQVEGALRVLLAGRTSIVIAHRIRSAERADRVVMIDAGQVIAQGTHTELIESSHRYRELVEVWQRGTQ
ncbi:MAG: ABC transporter ATP-binding protein [Acidobacteria bacterium]|nr:MAG: ABC transporter ATP-binding protein [Acidobacteriota bacterium]